MSTSLNPDHPLRSVLLIEADQGMRSLATNYLKAFGSGTIAVATSTAEADQLLIEGRYDLIVLDWKSKAIQGAEVYQRIRGSIDNASTFIILMAGQVTRSDIEVTLKDTKSKFIVKPFTQEVLFKSIDDFFHGRLKVFSGDGSDFSIQKGTREPAAQDLSVLKSNAAAGATSRRFEPKVNFSPVKEGPSTQVLIDQITIKPPTSHLAFDFPGLAPETVLEIRSQLKEIETSAVQKRLNAIIIDEDESLTNIIAVYLEQLNAGFIDVFADGREAWLSISRFDYDVIIMDWKSKGINGLCLYNRIRSRADLKLIPVIILSGQISKENFRILEDPKCTMVIEKPLQLQVFAKAVESIRNSTSVSRKVSAMAGSVIDKGLENRSQTFKLIKSLAAALPYGFDFLLAAGQHLIALKDFSFAEKLLELAAKLEPKNVTLMTEMAKVNLRLNRPTDSLHLLSEANHYSPGNIERLCLMGEAGLNLFQTDRARDFFKEALEVDPEADRARTGQIVTENLNQFLTTQEPSPVASKLASTLNLIGVSLIKNNKTEAGIEQYHSAMAFIHDKPTIARLQFNLGLAYFRSGDRKNAMAWLTEAVENAEKGFTKPKLWLDKIKQTKKNEVTWTEADLTENLAEGLEKLMMGTEDGE